MDLENRMDFWSIAAMDAARQRMQADQRHAEQMRATGPLSHPLWGRIGALLLGLGSWMAVRF